MHFSKSILSFVTRRIVFQLVIPKRIRLRVVSYLLVQNVWFHYWILFYSQGSKSYTVLAVLALKLKNL